MLKTQAELVDGKSLQQGKIRGLSIGNIKLGKKLPIAEQPTATQLITL
jgi:hypothetical protein